MKFPEDSLLPAKPEPGEIEDALKSVMHKNLRGGGYVLRRLSQMLGCTGMSGYNWLDYRENISGIVSRLAMVMVNAIGKDGRAGFDRYLDTLEAEAKSRGFADIQDVLRNDWRTKKADIAAQAGG